MVHIVGASKKVTLYLDEELYERLRQYALIRYGDRRGALRKALEELLRSGLDIDYDLIRRLEMGYPLGKIVDREGLHRY